MEFKREIVFDAKDKTEADAVMMSIKIILNSIKEKKHLVSLGSVVQRKPGLIEKGIPYLKML